VGGGVSIVICCYNSESTIGRVLDRLAVQKGIDGLEWEVVVVDNASTDRTVETARAAWTRGEIPFRVVYERKPGLSNARRKGLAEAVHEVVVFVDDDNLLDEGYISLAHQIMTGYPDVGLAGGLGIPLASVELPRWFKANEAAYAVGPQGGEAGYLPDNRIYLHGAGIVMRKSVWELLISSGFVFMLSGRKGQSLTSGEDTELSCVFRLTGYRLWYDPGLRFEHMIPENRLRWNYLIRLAREFGKSAVVLDIYIYNMRFRNLRSWQRLRVKYWILGMAVSTYKLLKILPGYLVLRVRHIEGNSIEFSFKYLYGYFLQKLKLAWKYREIRKEIDGLSERISRQP
jgi:glycosyltransferase involved in cell wall biosynthesis